MIRIRPIIASGLLASLLACAEGSKVETVQADRPANFQLENPPAQSQRGALIEATHVVTLSKDEIANGKLSSIYAGFKVAPQNGVHIYKVKYQTQTPAAVPVIASGLMLVPDTKAASNPWIALQHGTIAGKVDAPTVSPSEGIFEASLGFVTIVMDYIGYGSASNVLHPYLIEKAYADAGIDFIMATYDYAKKNAIGVGPFFLKGYSEGGYATLAIQKEIETKHPYIPLVASAPSAGPYDLDATARLLMAEPKVHPVNIPFLILSYTQWLSNNDFDPSNIFVQNPKDVAKYFNGQYSNSFILAENGPIPTDNDKMLKAELVADFLSAAPQKNESVKLHGYLQAQSLTNKGWKPRTKTLFSACKDDEVVPSKNVEFALQAFAGGALITKDNTPGIENVLESPAGGKYTHGNCPAIFAPTLVFLNILKTLPAAAK